MALIKTIEEFQKWVRVDSSFELEPILGDIDLVEDEIIRRKYLGPEFYDEFHQKYQAAEESLTADEKKLLKYLQQAVANLALESFVAVHQVHISTGGITRMENSSQKDAFRYQIYDLRKNCLKKGYNGLEKALGLLDEKIDDPAFQTWATTAGVSLHKKYFINSAAEFNEEYNIQSSVLTYLALVPIIKKLERFLIEPVTGPELFYELKDQVLDRELTPDNKKLLQDFIRPALAHAVVAKAAVESAFNLTSDGLELAVALMDDANSKEPSEANSESMLSKKIAAAQQDGQAYLVKLKNYLNEQASETKYAAYFNSPLYVAPGAEPVKDVVIRNSDATKPTFKFF